jgi:tetratricopeptide (TPR) repeat protein
MRTCGAILFSMALNVACSSSHEPSAPAAATLKEISLPEMSSAAAPVQQQIRERHASLQATLAKADASASAKALAFGEMGKLLVAAEYYDVAETCFMNARALAPADMRWPYYLGHVYRFKNDPGKAAQSFEQALALSPGHVPTLVWLADVHLAQNETDAAQPLLQKARTLDPGSGAVLFGLGRVALARQQYAQAVTYLEDALSRGPQATRIHYPLALAYRGLGDRAKAEEHLKLRGEVDLPPADPLLAELGGLLGNAAAYETRASKAMEERQWSEAAANLRKAVEIAPDNAQSRLNLGTSLFMLEDADGALEQYRAALHLSPALAQAHFGVGVVMEGRGRDREAIESFEAAVKSQPDYAEAQFSLANALRRTGRVKESLTHYEEVLRSNPAVSQASFGYAMGLVRLGRYAEARARLEDGMKQFSDQPGFAHALARVLAAAPDDRVRDGARALTIMNELLKSQRTIAMAETMAMALAESRRFDEAVRWQQDAITAATEGKRSDLAAKLSVNLRLYQSKQPCRMPWTDDDPVHHPAGGQ